MEHLVHFQNPILEEFQKELWKQLVRDEAISGKTAEGT